MARADSGGFDLVVGISPEYLQTRLEGLLPHQFDPTITFDWEWDMPGPINFDVHLALTTHLRLAIADVVVLPGPDGPRIEVGATTSVWFSWEDVTLIEDHVLLGADRWPKTGELDGSRPHDPAVAVRLGAAITSDGTDVQLRDLRGDVTLTGAPLTSIPAIAALQAGILDKLAELPLLDKLADLLTAFTAWLEHLPQALADAVTDALPASLPAVPLPFDEVRFTNVGRDVLALVSLWGTDGDEHAVTRSPIRRTAAGAPAGPLGLVVANDLMLRGARAALDPLLPNAGWRAPHPCHWRANHRLATVQDIGVDLTWVLGSVDEAGLLRLEVRFAGSHAGGGFGLTGSATFAIGVNDTFDAFVIDEPHLASLDVWVAWWVYALMAVGGGPIGVLVTGLLDAFAGGELAGALHRELDAAFPDTFPLPRPDTGLEPHAVSRVQPDAAWQLASICDSPPLVIPVSRAHDLIVALVDT